MRKVNPHGPIAEKIIRGIKQSFKEKIVDLTGWKAIKDHQKKIEEWHQDKDLSHLDALHAVYMDAQHRIADFIEIISELSLSDKLNQRYLEAEKIYMPSGPPMSPITQSYFTCWSACDMNVGIKRETYVTIMIDCYKAFSVNPDITRILECMQNSRMGLYIREGHDGEFVYLRELYTNQNLKVLVASKYKGVSGELWFVRLLLNPFGSFDDYWVAFTTPYIIINVPPGKPININKSLFYPEQVWLDFIKRNLPFTKKKEAKTAYHHFMKYGIGKHYWPEYIFWLFRNSRGFTKFSLYEFFVSF